MPIDIEELNPGTKFFYPDPEKESEEWVIIRALNITALYDISDKTEKERFQFVQPKDDKGKILRNLPMQRIAYTEVTDKDKRNELMWDYTIVDWQLFDKKGNKIPCTLENKLLLMNNDPAFANFWAEQIEKLMKATGQQDEDLRKN